MVFSARLPFCQVALKNSESRPEKIISDIF